MSPPALFDPTEASKRALRHGINRASMLRRRASHIGKRAGLATRRFTAHPTLRITDFDGRAPEFKYWNTSVTNVQTVIRYGDEDHVRVRGYTQPRHYFVKNIFKEPSTALYSNPEYARSSTCLSALSVEDEFEDFDGSYTIVTDSESSSIASTPDDFGLDESSTSQRTSLTSVSDSDSVASSFACATSCAVESTTNMSETPEPSGRSSLISLPEISLPEISLPEIPDSAPVLPDFSTDFEPFEVHFPAEASSIRISFTLPDHQAPTPEVLSPLPSLLRPGVTRQLDIVEESWPSTPELPPPDYLPVIPRFAPFDPYNQAYIPNPAGRYSGMRWAPINSGRNRRRPYTVGDISALSTPQFATEGVPSSTNELFLSPRPSPRLPNELLSADEVVESTSSTPSSQERPITITLTPSSTHTIPRKPVPKAETPPPKPAIQPTCPAPQARHTHRFTPETTPSLHATNLSSPYPHLDKPLPPPPSRAPHNAPHRGNKQTPQPTRATQAEPDRPTKPVAPTTLHTDYTSAEPEERHASSRTISGNFSHERNVSRTAKAGNVKATFKKGWNKVFGRK